MKAKPFIAATANIYFMLRGFTLRKSMVMLSILAGIEKISTRTESTRHPIAKGVAFRTYFKLGR